MIPHSQPTLDEKDAQAVAEVVRSGYIAEGEKVRALEKKTAAIAGKKFGVATGSGTAALHLSLLALGIGDDDSVAFPSYVCSSLLQAVRASGAKPLLIDIAPDSLEMDIEDLEKKISAKTRAIIIPHLFGQPADIDPFKKFGVPIIEDCAQTIGAKCGKMPVGSLGDMSLFSFYATKVLTSGEGGMICSDSEDIVSKIRDRRAYDNKMDFVQRFNYKMTDIHAALGLSQLTKLDFFIKRRRELAERYEREFSSLPLSLPRRIPERESIYFRYIIRIPVDLNIDEFISRMMDAGVVCMKPVFKPVHQLLRQDGFPATDWAWERSVSIPIYPGLKEEQLKIITTAVTRFPWKGEKPSF